MVNRLLLVIGFVFMPLLAQAQQAPLLSAFVDRTDISISDVFTLTLRIDSTLGNSRPSMAGINRDFDQVGGISTRSTYTNNNGVIQSWTEYSIMLRPKTTGTLTIPAFRLGGEVSTPIRINVGEASQITNSGNDEIFIVSTVSKDQVYVQEQLLYTIKIYYSIGFDQGAQLTSPQVADAVVQQLGTDANYQEVVDGIGYNVTERKFVIFPQSSDELIIPPVYFTATIGRRGGINRFFNNRNSVREVNLATETHSIEVLARPANSPGQTWLPAASLTLVEDWSGPLDNLEIGDSVTRNIVITAEGLSSSLLPGIEYNDIDGLKFYPDQPEREDAADGNGVMGIRSEGTAIVPSEAGEFELPEIRLPWWNTTTNTQEFAVLPARTLSVLPGTGASSTPQTQAPGAGTDFNFTDSQNPSFSSGPLTPASQTSGLYLFWIVSTAFFATAWLFSTMMWLRSKRMLAYAEVTGPQQGKTASPIPTTGKKNIRAEKNLDLSSSIRVLKTACESKHLPDIKKATIAWAKAFYNNHSILTLEQLARASDNPALKEQTGKLESALYSGVEGEFDTKAFFTLINSINKAGNKNASKGKSDYSLPPLYKN